MLAFIDLPKAIRFLRVENVGETIVRTPLGQVSKSNFSVKTPLSDEFTEDEAAEAQGIIDGYVEADLVRRRGSVLNLPVILREAVEYLEADANDIERAFIVSAITEAMRRMRKSERAL